MDLQIGYKCNNNCISCILPETAKDVERDVDSLLRYIRQEKPEVLAVGGGEPTIYENFFELLERVRDIDDEIELHVITNGRKFSDEEFAAKDWESLEPIKFSVSLYGHEKEIHEYVTRAEGSFKETVKGIENIVSRGLEIDVKYILNRKNFVFLPDMVKFSREEFGSDIRPIFIMPRYTGRAWKNRDRIKVDFESVAPYVEIAYEFFSEKFQLYHFPPCKLREEVRQVAETGVTKHSGEGILFPEGCDRCRLRQKCPGIWETYIEIFPDFEPEPFTNPS